MKPSTEGDRAESVESRFVTIHLAPPQHSERITLRSATTEDAAQIIALSRTTDRFRVSPYTGRELDDHELLFWIEDDRSIVLVACTHDAVIAYAHGVSVSPKWFFFDGFLIAPQARRCGLGKQLYSYLVDICRHRGLQLIQGLVKQGDGSSLDYWLQRGFEPGSPCLWVEHWIDE